MRGSPSPISFGAVVNLNEWIQRLYGVHLPTPSPGDGHMASDGPSLPTTDLGPDLSREQVIDIYKQAGDAELRRHIPLLQTDGKGFIGFLCGCGQTFSHDAWWVHIQAKVKYVTKR